MLTMVIANLFDATPPFREISTCDNGHTPGHCASPCLCINSTPCCLHEVRYMKKKNYLL